MINGAGCRSALACFIFKLAQKTFVRVANVQNLKMIFRLVHVIKAKASAAHIAIMKVACPARFFIGISVRQRLPQGFDSSSANVERRFCIGKIEKLGVVEVVW
jgi:hypothetical protein